jgi:hypothetical protein
MLRAQHRKITRTSETTTAVSDRDDDTAPHPPSDPPRELLDASQLTIISSCPVSRLTVFDACNSVGSGNNENDKDGSDRTAVGAARGNNNDADAAAAPATDAGTEEDADEAGDSIKRK